MGHAEPESLSPLPGSLALASALAAVAGCLDALSLDRLTGTFVAFQSGNTVLVGLEIGNGHLSRAWPPLVAVLMYIVGSTLTPSVIRFGNGTRGAPQRLLAWASLLLSADAAVVLIGFGPGSERPVGILRYLGIVMATLAMAMQTPVVRRVQGVTVSSTFSSGMLVRFGQSLGDLLRPGSRAHERPVARILGIVNAAFLGGAIFGGLAIKLVDNLAILAPTIALPVIALLLVRPAPAP